MRTKGLMVLEGYVCPESVESARGYGLVPSQFWNRLKQQIAIARRMDQFRSEAQAAKDGGFDSERALFVRWCGLVGFIPPQGHYPDQLLWPWTRGWTDELLDSYLTTLAREAA